MKYPNPQNFRHFHAIFVDLPLARHYSICKSLVTKVNYFRASYIALTEWHHQLHPLDYRKIDTLSFMDSSN